MTAIRRTFLTPDSVDVLRKMRADIEQLKRPGRPPRKRRAVGGGGGGYVIDYAVLRAVHDDERELEVAIAKLTDDPDVIEIENDEEGQEITQRRRAEPGIPVAWYSPLVWRGAPTIQTPFLKVSVVGGRLVVWQVLKFPLVAPPNPLQFPPGACFLLPRGG